MKDKIDLPGAVLVAALLIAGVGALALKETNLGTTMIGLAIGLVMPSPMKPGGPGSGGLSGAALAVVAGLVTLQGCTDSDMPAGLSLLLGVLGALALTLSHAKALLTRFIAGAMVMFAVGCGGYATVPVYAVTVTACVAAEQSVAARPPTTEEHHLQMLTTVHEVCGVILEAVRELDIAEAQP